jgi:hypothetical protein
VQEPIGDSLALDLCGEISALCDSGNPERLTSDLVLKESTYFAEKESTISAASRGVSEWADTLQPGLDAVMLQPCDAISPRRFRAKCDGRHILRLCAGHVARNFAC